jgi:23S rRNA pseudouridine2605 synthase
MMEAVGHAVSRLIRIRYGAVMLPRGLRRGVWMELDHRDVDRLSNAAGMPQERTPAQAPAPSRRPRGKGPRPSVPKLVDGPLLPRSGGGRRAERRHAGAEDSTQPDPMKTSYGYLDADRPAARGRPNAGRGRKGRG